jgi:hypothetical protein
MHRLESVTMLGSNRTKENIPFFELRILKIIEEDIFYEKKFN